MGREIMMGVAEKIERSRVEGMKRRQIEAAAPDMLAALKAADGHLSVLLGNIHGSAKVDHRWEGMEDVVRGWRDEINAAIAKAEGKP